MRSPITLLTLVLLPVVFATSDLGAARYASETEQLFAVESLGHADGSFSYRHWAYDRQADRFVRVKPRADRQPQSQHDNFQRLLVQQSSKWGRRSTQNWRWAEKTNSTMDQHLNRNRPLVRQVKSLVNKRKGDPDIPSFNLQNRKLRIRDFPMDPVREYEQFNSDSFNVIARTSDNRFFRFDRQDITSRAIRFEFASCSLSGGRFRCPFFIVECDIYLKASTPTALGFFEDLGALQQRQALAGHYKFCHGHASNTWGHDLSGNRSRELNQQAFNRNNSRTWRLEREEDSGLYNDSGAAAVGPGPFLLPSRSAVIDVGFVKPPIYDETRSAKENAFQYDALVLTNLRGFSNRKDMRLEIFRGRNTRRQNRILGPLRGTSIDRGLRVGNRPGVRRYFASYLSVGRMPDWERLLEALTQPRNEGKSVRGISYDYVMEVTIKVSGFLRESGSRQTITNVYNLVYNENEERDADVVLTVF